MENNDWKILLPNIGTGLLCAGIPVMLMEHYQYFYPGLVITIVGLFLIGFATFIKSNDQLFWEFINRAVLYAQEKSQAQIIVFDSPHKLNDDRLTDTEFQNFMYDIVNAIACFYKLDKAREIKEEIFELYKPYKDPETNLLDVECEAERVKKAYEMLATYLAIFQDVKDHSAYHSSDFKPSELKRYKNFSSKKWRQFSFEK